jgi:microfibrillar-associated protein 1
MPPPKAKKMTAQPVRTRHFVGKPAAAEVEEPSSEDESASEAEPQPKPAAKPKRAPAASSFPGAAFKSTLAARQKAEAERKRLEAEFETESEAESGESGSESGSGSGEESSEEEESSSEEEAPKKLLRPVFLKKGQRNQTGPPPKTAEELAEEEEQRRQAQTRALVQAQVEQRVAQKAKKKDWDDEVEGADIDAVDDTDGLDPEAEYAAWKLRELKRIRRARAAIEEAEAERAEIERRRNLTDAERDAEDRAFLEKQKEERGERGQMSYMQKYYHKGAFFQEDLKELGLDQRNFMGAQFEDATNREVLPEYMQIRDMTKLGKKGRTRYRDMKSEDTGRWGEFGDDRRPKDKNDYGLDDRFKSDNYRGGERDRDREGATGANAKPLGERKRLGEDSNRDGKRPRVDDR